MNSRRPRTATRDDIDRAFRLTQLRWYHTLLAIREEGLEASGSQLFVSVITNTTHDLVVLELVTTLEEALGLLIEERFPSQGPLHTLHQRLTFLNHHGLLTRYDDLLQIKAYRNVFLHQARPVIGIEIEWAFDLVAAEFAHLGIVVTRLSPELRA